MMKKTFILRAAALGAALSLASCGGGFSTQEISFRGSFALTEGREDSLKIDISAEYPAAGLKEQAMLKMSSAITEALFGEEYAGMPPETAMQAYRNDLTEEYRAENLPMLDREELAGSMMSWEDMVAGEADTWEGKTLSYTVTRYSYRGGAHGMSSETSYNFDMKSGEAIGECDFFREGYEARLTQLLSAHLPESLESPADTSMMFLREIGPNGNFRLSDDGVTYIYNQYEIAPYSMGVIRITIPWDELDGILR